MDLVVALDLNAHPTWVVDLAVRWAERLHATLHLRTVSAVQWDATAMFGSEDQALATEWGRVRRAEATALHRLLAARVPEARQGTAEVLSGTIDHAFADLDADGIVCATHGRQGIPRLFFGSTSEAIVRGSHRPTLVLRLHEDEGAPVATSRILVAVDPSEPSTAAVELVRSWFPEAEVTVGSVLFHQQGMLGTADLWVPDQGGSVEDHPHYDWAVERLAPVVDAAGGGRPRLLLAEAQGAGAAIADTAAGYDLVALTTHGRTGLARLWWGSTAERVARLAEVPVLVVPLAQSAG